MIQTVDRRRLRSAQTRERLLAVGTTVFAERGFEGATTRSLAEAAGVNQAAILYHFGGKEGLYAAIAETIATRAGSAMRPYLEAGIAAKRKQTPPQARAALGTLVAGLLYALLAVAGDGSAAAFIVREQASPGAAFELLYKEYIRPVHERVTALVATATRRSPDNVGAILDAHAIVGMALAFIVARETALRRVGWRAYDAEHVEQIAEVVADLAERAVTSLGANRG